MQALGLVNELLDNTKTTMHKGLLIQRFSCTPLSASVGIVEWIHNTDTLNTLITEYRSSHNKLIKTEWDEFTKISGNKSYNSIDELLQAYKRSISITDGMDIANILWLKSISSEIWIEKRALYVKSLATMSMVGYLMGMGDRHCSNIMLDRRTGRIVHIDFGDCFETAMHRERLPEKVPFRLTRMLVYAMEVKSYEGSFRLTCERIMTVLRDSENIESLMAMLEAFVYDPLINWRLVQEPRYRNEDENSDDDNVNTPQSENGSFIFENEFLNRPSDSSSSIASNLSFSSRGRRMSISAAVYDVADEKRIINIFRSFNGRS